MGPTKAVVKQQALYHAVSGKLIHSGFPSYRALADYVKQHYIVLPVHDNAGKPWQLDGQPIYCLHGVQYETVDDRRVHLTRCPDCGGMGVRAKELTVESDCIRCAACGHEFDARLEMMET
ncbi:MAG: hypothetical protein JNL86_15235 [Nitrospira sp.]|jgi:hypothetical protein|nr:hypothetical protein [Nitrospira sp.]MCC7471761.1 hypothetical protein [Candidatus Nomurabacteria bacterium]